MGLDYQFIHRTGALHVEDGRPKAAVADLNPPRAVLELVPQSVARENTILPLSLDGETLTCAAAHPDLLVQDKLSFILNKRVRLVAAPPEAIRAAIDRHYSCSPNPPTRCSASSRIRPLSSRTTTGGPGGAPGDWAPTSRRWPGHSARP